MSIQFNFVDQLPYVTAKLNYLAPTAYKPVSYAYEPPPGVPRFNATREAHEVPIYDARPIRQTLSLDFEGFVLADHASTVRDFWNDDEVRDVYYPEAERLVQELTGATRVVIFDHTRRRRRAERPPLDGRRSSSRGQRA